MSSRKEIITSLLEFDSDIVSLSKRVAGLGWDSEEEVQCLPRHIRQVLERYLKGILGAEGVEAWANLIEGRDDIEVQIALREIIFELANPSITQRLTPERSHALMNDLNDWK
jgi:hypothetical protein